MNKLEQEIREAQQRAGDGEDWEYDQPAVLQRLIDSGACWGMEGSVGQAASDALELGVCFLPSVWKDEADRTLNVENMKLFKSQLKAPTRDYYGNLIPYREMLKPGSKGTLENAREFWASRALNN